MAKTVDLYRDWTDFASVSALALTISDPALARSQVALMIFSVLSDALGICLSVGLQPGPAVYRR